MIDLKIQAPPFARAEDILVETLDDEVLIYDLRTHEVTCLNASAALIWDLADGQRTIGDIVDAVGSAEVTEGHVAAILDQLRDKNLLEVDATLAADRVQAPTSRRSFLGNAAAASMVLPVLMSTRVPAAAQTVPEFAPCTGDSSCDQDAGQKCCSYAPSEKCCLTVDDCKDAMATDIEKCVNFGQ